MKRIAFRLSSTIALLGFGAMAASASTPGGKFRVDVPFDFIAGKTVLPAGDYTVTCDRVPGLVQFTDQKGHIWVALNVREQSRNVEAKKSSVTFNHRGDEYFLAGIKRRGDDRVYSPKMSARERELVASGK